MFNFRQGHFDLDIAALQFLYGAPETDFEGVTRFLYAEPGYYQAHYRVDENISTDTVAGNAHAEQINPRGFQFRQKNHLFITETVYSLEPGKWDNDLFTIDPVTADIRFRRSPDYENPRDAYGGYLYGGNNTYQLLVTENYSYRYKYSDGRLGDLNFADIDYAYLITVEDVDEPEPGVAPDVL